MRRRTTVRRRLVRRLALLRQKTLGDYTQYVKENPDELHALAQDILIRVTRFFRDADAFDALSRKVFPEAEGPEEMWQRHMLNRSVQDFIAGIGRPQLGTDPRFVDFPARRAKGT